MSRKQHSHLCMDAKDCGFNSILQGFHRVIIDVVSHGFHHDRAVRVVVGSLVTVNSMNAVSTVPVVHGQLREMRPVPGHPPTSWQLLWQPSGTQARWQQPWAGETCRHQWCEALQILYEQMSRSHTSSRPSVNMQSIAEQWCQVTALRAMHMHETWKVA